MLRGLYTAATGLSAIMFRNEIETNNLTNAKTGGYKKEEVLFKSFQSRLNSMISYERPLTSARVPIGKLGRGVKVDDIITYFDMQGELINTGRDFDLAINGNGYLVLENSAGERFYTRNGSFDLNQNAQLTNDDGYLVMGERGPVVIKGKLVDIHDDGKIYVDGEYIDTLLKVDLVEPKKYGGNLFVSDNPPTEATGKVLQGYLEQSNAHPIEGMTKYLKNLRAYEANQKVVQAYDGTLEKLINEVGRV
ncbi:MAG: flagellar basal-body rod protein FlgF [Clostridia bacterium]|jgi:flagellar basal-body rod protein FlgG|nr:flagellar basal-body rod protein FlgF [Clostridia bacterium]